MSEIPKEAIDATKASLEAFGVGRGVAAQHAGSVIQAPLPFLRKQFEDEHPVLAVIERAREEGYRLTIGTGGTMVTGVTLWRDGTHAANVHGDSLDECARELLANWPEEN